MRSLLDPKTLANLRALQRPGGSDVLSQIVHLYLEKAPQLLDLLREAVTRNDASAIFRLAHSLKSSSGNVGAVTLAELCQGLEVMGRTQHTAEAPETLVAIEAEYAMVQEALAAELRKQPQPQHRTLDEEQSP
jgi:HPt (histidine-containing phosphotransfer) domain-containing protein